MPPDEELPSVQFLVRPGAENAWSDLLGSLIATDPRPVIRLLGLDVRPDEITVEREVSLDRRNRPDLLLRTATRQLSVIEVKVLSGLGPQQLQRYEAAMPDAEHYVVVSPERLVVDVNASPSWRGVTWESILDMYAESSNAWCRATALAWRAYLDTVFPKVESNTRWNELREGENFPIAMRARLSWVYSHLRPPPPVEHDLVGSAAGNSAVVRAFADASVPGYRVMAEVEEGLGVREIPKFADAAQPPRGPSIKVVLLQQGVTTSAEFDWDYLLALWPLMDAARGDWVRNSARPRRGHDRENHRAMVAKGGPKHLGIGFGDGQARRRGVCMFGARIQLDPDITLHEVVDTMEEMAELVLAMSKVQPGDSS